MRPNRYLLFKYSLSSLGSTAVDFGLFYALFCATAHAGGATLVGWSVGAAVAFYLQKHWVFGWSNATPWRKLGARYGTGVLLGLSLNAGGVWLLCDELGLSPWFSRISVALLAWYIVFLFNRYFVFTSPNEP